jgi:hypothetical protein
MTDEQPRARGTVPVAKHLFYLADSGITPRARFVSRNGLTMTQPGIVVVFTGISSGPVTVAVDPRQSPPTGVDVDGWDVVVELPVEAPTGRMVVTGVMADAPAASTSTPTTAPWRGHPP